MSLRQILVWLLMLAVAVSGIAWWYANFEQRTEKERFGLQGRAGSDPWLAAGRLLERAGARVQELKSPSALEALPKGAMLILPGNRHAITPAARAAMFQWLEDGGVLIVEAEEAQQPDPVLDTLGVQRSMRDKDGNITVQPRRFDDRKSTRKAILADGTQPLAVQLRRGLVLEAAHAQREIAGDFGAAGLTLDYGNGEVIVLNDLEWLSNHHIRDFQHPEFLWQMLPPDPAGFQVLVFNSPQKLSLTLWLREHAWTAVFGIAIGLVLWFWYKAPRFGPVAADPPRTRRRLLDHLRASGRFLWANGGAHRLLESARESALRQLAHAHPDFSAGSSPLREARVAELLGLDAGSTHALFTKSPATLRTFEFMHAVRIYQSVQEKLSLQRTAPRANKRNP